MNSLFVSLKDVDLNTTAIENRYEKHYKINNPYFSILCVRIKKNFKEDAFMILRLEGQI